jgi:hypothetical protein
VVLVIVLAEELRTEYCNSSFTSRPSIMQNIAVVFVVFISATTIFHECLCYPSGAPNTQCENMTPNHGYSPQANGASPYDIKVAKSYYVPGQNVRVSIESSSDDIKGFLIQARKVGENSAIGTFAALPTKGRYANCSNTKVDTS